MTTIVGISGSLRERSFNTMLLQAAQQAMPASSQLVIESIREIPLYNADDEAASGIPEPVTRLKQAIAEADGLLIATPEYNNGIPGVAKNAIDWLSRPPADIARVFRTKPVAIVGASTGAFGTILAQDAWLPVFRLLGADLWSGSRVLVSRAGSVFDPTGAIVDERVREALARFLDGFVSHARRQR